MSTTIPPNIEHIEAEQAALDTKREQRRAEMTPEERARLAVIEECSAKLEAAKVPFLLWASSAYDETTGLANGFWQFNKLAYDYGEDVKVLGERLAHNKTSLAQVLIPWMSKGCTKEYQVIYGLDGKAKVVLYDGRVYSPDEFVALIQASQDAASDGVSEGEDRT